MRRGLMVRDESELPQSVLATRLEGLRAVVARDGLDGFVCYTNLVQPAAVAYLTGFTPYWSDGLLLVTGSGAPVFATALSKRVAGWIASTNPVSEIICTPKPGAAIGARLAAEHARRVGVLELDRLPGGLYEEIMGAAPALELIDGSAAFATLRHRVDQSERRLLEHADAIAREALSRIDATQVRNAGEAAGLVEKQARLRGAEEAYIAVAPDLAAELRPIRVSGRLALADRFALRASVAYKGSWVRRTRSFAKDAAGQEAVAHVDAWLTTLIASITPERPISAQLAEHADALPGATLAGWMVESAIGSYPLEVIASSRAPDRNGLPDGSFAVLTVGLSLDGVPWLGAAPVFARPPG